MNWIISNVKTTCSRLSDSIPNLTRRNVPLRESYTLLRDKFCMSSGIVMKSLIFALFVVFAFGCVSAQEPPWQPSESDRRRDIYKGVGLHLS
jgi:hypothetical protein